MYRRNQFEDHQGHLQPKSGILLQRYKIEYNHQVNLGQVISSKFLDKRLRQCQGPHFRELSHRLRDYRHLFKIKLPSSHPCSLIGNRFHPQTLSVLALQLFRSD